MRFPDGYSGTNEVDLKAAKSESCTSTGSNEGGFLYRRNGLSTLKTLKARARYSGKENDGRFLCLKVIISSTSWKSFSAFN